MARHEMTEDVPDNWHRQQVRKRPDPGDGTAPDFVHPWWWDWDNGEWRAVREGGDHPRSLQYVRR